VTARDLYDRAVSRARSLRALGLERGDRIGIVMPNTIEYHEVLFGAALLGVVVVTINARYRTAELAYVVADSGVKVVLTHDVIADQVDFVHLLAEALPGLEDADDPRALAIEGAPDLGACVMLGASSPAGFLDRAAFEALASAVPEEEIDEVAASVFIRDVAIMMYTSGTTAQPKGCPLTHESIVRVADAMNQRFSLTSEDVWWDPLPMFHLSSILPLTSGLLVGARFATMTDFEPGVALEQIERERATYLFATFPTVNQELTDHPDFKTRDLSAVRLVNQVSPPDSQHAFQARFPQAIQVAAYGCTELGGIVSQNDPAETAEQRATTCGRPWPGVEIRICDPDTGADLPQGERGEIVGRFWGMFEGYHNDPERNAEAIEPGGWFHTGDIGSLDEDGRITYHGRTKDMLKVGGENVAAIEIEGYLVQHPAVSIAQVVGVPDARYDEVPAAFVELAPGATLTESELVDFCIGTIATYKVPRYVRFVTEWPMSGTKVKKFVLKDQLTAELAAAGITEAAKIVSARSGVDA
jgi:fatty-acyl-CoA synthase